MWEHSRSARNLPFTIFSTDLIITRAGKPAVKLVMATRSERKLRKGMFGSGIGKLWIAEDAFSPETDADSASLRGRRSFGNQRVKSCTDQKIILPSWKPLKEGDFEREKFIAEKRRSVSPDFVKTGSCDQGASMKAQ